MSDILSKAVTRAQLEGLSTDELTRTADSYGIDIPPGLDRIFIIGEILECAGEEIDTSADKNEDNPVVDSAYPEAVFLPKQYNITFIDVMIRDPLWAFVFWEIKGQDKETHENDPDFNGYCLRVIPVNEEGIEELSDEKSFTIMVGSQDNARYLGFAEKTGEGYSLDSSGSYIIKLSVLYGETEKEIISSRIFSLPKLYEDETLSN
ncbi:MAG: DUF4912 domain-containing protein, partial [Treponema sp.]|nr:DUF4912 domain-containing protein [Treponema sp.]